MDKVPDAVASFLTTIGPAGYPTSLLGGVLMLFFYLRKQEAGVRNDIVLSLQRLQGDKEALQRSIDLLKAELDVRETEIDKLRAERRELEDKAYNESRRADNALESLRKIQRVRESE